MVIHIGGGGGGGGGGSCIAWQRLPGMTRIGHVKPYQCCVLSAKYFDGTIEIYCKVLFWHTYG